MIIEKDRNLIAKLKILVDRLYMIIKFLIFVKKCFLLQSKINQTILHFLSQALVFKMKFKKKLKRLELITPNNNKLNFCFLHQVLVLEMKFKVKKSAMKYNHRFFKIFNKNLMINKIYF